MAVELHQNTFDSFVAQQGAVLVDFWAVWCGPCRMLAPVIDEVAAANPALKVGKVNVDECGELAERFGIMSIPTLLLFRNGQLVDKRVGYMPAADLQAMVGKAL